MSKTILTQVEGFTPVIDNVVESVGLSSAIVFGRIWRYCQMIDGVCKASQETIADDLGLSRATINKHIEVLVMNGYLQDITPNLVGHPHKYKDTGKAGLSINITAKEEPVKNIDAQSKKILQPAVKNIDIKIVKDTNKDTITSFEKPSKEEPTRVPCDMDGIPDDWKDKPKKKKEKKQPDPRYTHPAYTAFYNLTKSRPPALLVDDVIKTLGDYPDIEKMEACLKAWVMRHYNPLNLNWLFEWYVSGIPGYQKNNAQTARDKSNELLRQSMQEAMEEENGR
jgi:hypothetical protein